MYRPALPTGLQGHLVSATMDHAVVLLEPIVPEDDIFCNREHKTADVEHKAICQA